jgi:Holliday junction resolvasome RuvABC ATP-dependent DNA helicase subunit
MENTAPNQQWSLQFHEGGNAPSIAERKWAVNPDNPRCPFFNFVGNREALNLLSIGAYKALGHPNHLCADESFAILGPSSTGKTMLAKLFAKVVGLPFVELQGQQLTSMDVALKEIAKVLEETKFNHPVYGELDCGLVGGYNPNNPSDMGYFLLPPCIVFIDEVESLNKNLRKGLLKAIEADDRILATEKGWIADTQNVCWGIATTDAGQMADEFVNRFTRVDLNLYSKAEIAQIINYVHPDWDRSVCDLVAHYCGTVPRESKAFAKKMKTLHEMNESDCWETTALKCARAHQIDEFGMSHQRVRVLSALGQGPVASNRMPVLAGCKAKELDKFLMPPLMAITEDQPIPLVTISSQGYSITPAGLAELDQRQMKNSGTNAIARSVRDMYDAA